MSAQDIAIGHMLDGHPGVVPFLILGFIVLVFAVVSLMEKGGR